MGPEAFEFVLPPEQIAREPAARRGDGRMMVVPPAGEPVHAHARDLPEFVPADALLVVNESRVVPARAQGRRADGRSFELLFCAPAPGLGPGAQVAAWVRGSRALGEGDLLQVGDGPEALVLRAKARHPGDGRVRKFMIVSGGLLESLEVSGEVPLPPYIPRPAGPRPEDRDRYQTVYAGPPGSVAAPTAGLHLEPEVLARLDVVALTLHVGPGTFLPMDAEDVADHRVDPERVSLGAEAAAAIEEARRAGRPILAVGTTVVRALESVAARHGGDVVPFAGETDLVVTPGFGFKVVTDLLTNFHLPRSSLLMLVCSFGGRERVLASYGRATAAGYRFYSYGDCMLIGRAR